MPTSDYPGRAKPFSVEPVLLTLREQYPRSDQIRCLADARARRSREAFVRLWLSEGIPFAFQECPALYDEVRVWVAARLTVNAKDVTLLGSARLGFSLAAPPNFGRPFGPASDLDLGVVSRDLFKRVADSLHAWERDYRSESTMPRSEKERFLWEQNLAFAHRNLPQGFFDPNKIPTFDRYPLAQEVGQAMWALVRKLEQTPGAPVPRRASVRVYETWKALIERVSMNLYSALVRAAA